MKVSELEGAMLDYWVKKALGVNDPLMAGIKWEYETRSSYSTDWAKGGPILEREGIQIAPMRLGDVWEIKSWHASRRNRGALACDQEAETPLIAAMRCFVASKFGEEVPDEVTT